MTDPFSFLGESFTFQDPKEEILKNLRLIIRIRWFVSPSIFIIIIIAGAFGLTKANFLSENQLIVNGLNLAVILVMNIAYAVLVRKIQNIGPLVLFQLIIDVVHYSLTIYKTGGITSPFTFLYFLVIFSAAIIVTGKTAYIISGLCSVLFTLIIVGINRGIVPNQDFFSPFSGLERNNSYIILSWSFSIFSFFAFAALASYLSNLLHSRQLRLRESNSVLARKNKTMLLLYRTSEALNAYRTVSDVVDYILNQLVDYLQLDRALLYVNIKNEYLHLYKTKTRGPESGNLSVTMPLEDDAGLTARAALRKEAYNITDPENSPYINKELAKKIGLNPFALSPLIIRDKVIGVIGIDRSINSGSITEDEFSVLKMFANQAAITIDSLQRVDKTFRDKYNM
jgi:hypothetical protein